MESNFTFLVYGRYHIKSEKHDIGFGFLYKPANNSVCKEKDMEVIKDVERMNTHMVQHFGTIDCHKPGICK